MGGWASAWFAALHPDTVAALVLLAPAFRFLHARWESLDEASRRRWQAEGTLRFRNQWLDVELGHGLVAERDRFDPDVLAARWATPALIYHGMADEAVPWQDSVRLVEATAYPRIELRLLRDGDHRMTAYRDLVAEDACRFFARGR
jgi:pimeloyl-ACP methyl ester carboxylesterase